MIKLCYSILFVLLVNFKFSAGLECIVCKESEYPNQCGEVFNPLPKTLPTIQCDEACVTFKIIYDGGRESICSCF